MDPLALDILAETARGFFGARVQLEKKIQLLEAFVAALAQKADTLRGFAAYLNHLLMTPQNAAAFYAAMGVPDAPFSTIPGEDRPGPEENAGVALTAKGKYYKLLRQAYARLETACRDYLYGAEDEESTSEEIPVYLSMIMKMAEVINSEIKALNRNRPPSDTLQFVGQLNTGARAKTAATGTPSQYAGMDEKLGYAPVDINALNIVRIPELPPLQNADPQIRRFIEQLYATQKKQVKALLAELRRSSRG